MIRSRGRRAPHREDAYPVWTLEGYRRLGWSDERILESFPALRPVDLLAAFAYAAEHETELDRDIAENESA